MKKLMIAACAMAMAVAAQAATVNWKADAAIFNPGGADGRVAAGEKAYLISVSDWSRTALLSAFDTFGGTAADFAASTAWKSAAQIASATTSANGKVPSNPYTSTVLPSATGSKSAYYVIVKGDNMFVSTELSAPWVQVGDSYTFQFTSVDNQNGSKQAAMLASGGLGSSYNGAGWYYNDVPEPTSGLLLLLGVAGLALRRRRA